MKGGGDRLKGGGGSAPLSPFRGNTVYIGYKVVYNIIQLRMIRVATCIYMYIRIYFASFGALEVANKHS